MDQNNSIQTRNAAQSSSRDMSHLSSDFMNAPSISRGDAVARKDSGLRGNNAESEDLPRPDKSEFSSRFEASLKKTQDNGPAQNAHKSKNVKPEENPDNSNPAAETQVLLEDKIKEHHKLNEILDLLAQIMAEAENGEPAKLEELMAALNDKLENGGLNLIDVLQGMSGNGLKSIEETLAALKENFPGSDFLNLDTLISELKGSIAEKAGEDPDSMPKPAITKGDIDLKTIEELKQIKAEINKVLETLKEKIAQAMEKYNSLQNNKEQPSKEGEDKTGEQPGKKFEGMETVSRTDAQNPMPSGGNMASEFEARFNPALNAGQNANNLSANTLSSVQVPVAPYTDNQSLEIISQITKGIASVSKGDLHEVRIQLVPEHLGKVQISLEMHSGVMAGKIAVENDSVRQLVETNIPQLRESIEALNIKLGSLEVTVDYNRAFLSWQRDRNGQSARFSGQHGRKESAEKDIVEEQIKFGSDTGRKLGYNTIELVA